MQTLTDEGLSLLGVFRRFNPAATKPLRALASHIAAIEAQAAAPYLDALQELVETEPGRWEHPDGHDADGECLVGTVLRLLKEAGRPI